MDKIALLEELAELRKRCDGLQKAVVELEAENALLRFKLME